MAPRIRTFSSIAIVALCLLAGYFAGRSFWTPPLAESPAAPALASMPERVPAFALKDLSGSLRSNAEWSGQAQIINFWATWCAPCRKEMPLLEQLHAERGGKGLAVIGIALDREEPVKTFIAEAGVSYPILVGEQEAMAVAESFAPDFVGLPLTAIAAPGGSMLKLHMGEIHPEDLARFVDVLDRLAAGRLNLAQARDALK